MGTDFTLTALSPLDGRYRLLIAPLVPYFSEGALIKYRVQIEISYLLFLSQKKIISQFTSVHIKQLKKIMNNFSDSEAGVVKKIEEKIRHDVKAVEYYIREKLTILNIPNREFIHFALTSEDTNSLAQGFMLKEGLFTVILPEIQKLILQISELAKTYRETPMLARTHGQPGIPTTVGKELVVFAVRLNTELKRLEKLPIEAKLTGAVGTLAAHQVSYPNIDWLLLTQEFIASLGLTPNNVTTQILPADSYARIFQSIQLINTILVGLTQDMWRYISDGYFGQKIKTGEVGSSTMPQKVNPIDFENAEGNLGLANALLTHFSEKLPISRLQRDLSDSTVKRNIGVALGYSLLAYKNCQRGLKKVAVNEFYVKEDLLSHWEVITEGLQTILRKYGDETAYEKLKTFGRGKQLTKRDLKEFIGGLSVNQKVKQELEKVSPLTYVGLAGKIVDVGLKQITYAKK